MYNIYTPYFQYVILFFTYLLLFPSSFIMTAKYYKVVMTKILEKEALMTLNELDETFITMDPLLLLRHCYIEHPL